MKILLIEDDKICALGAKHTLEKAGHDVNVADNAEDGLLAIACISYDILITDMDLPDLHGSYVAACANIIKRNKYMRVLALSGNSAYAIPHVLDGFGIQDVIMKPLDDRKMVRINWFNKCQ